MTRLSKVEAFGNGMMGIRRRLLHIHRCRKGSIPPRCELPALYQPLSNEFLMAAGTRCSIDGRMTVEIISLSHVGSSNAIRLTDFLYRVLLGQIRMATSDGSTMRVPFHCAAWKI